MNYKVGDRVVIKSLDWYNENKSPLGDVDVPLTFNYDMSFYCGRSARIIDVIFNFNNQYYYYKIDIDNVGCSGWNWTKEMFEDIKVLRRKKLIKLVDTNE